MRDMAVVLNWTGTLAPAQHELSDSEINKQFGSLLGAAVSAFREDPSYIVEMAESAASLRNRRAARLRDAS